MTGKQRIREILQQSVQFTLLGDFPTAVPKDHNNWVNVMGKVYAFDFDQALDSIEEVVKEVLGDQQPIADSPTRPILDHEAHHQNKLLIKQLGRWGSK